MKNYTLFRKRLIVALLTGTININDFIYLGRRNLHKLVEDFILNLKMGKINYESGKLLHALPILLDMDRNGLKPCFKLILLKVFNKITDQDFNEKLIDMSTENHISTDNLGKLLVIRL
jgi:hypothetical protein